MDVAIKRADGELFGLIANEQKPRLVFLFSTRCPARCYQVAAATREQRRVQLCRNEVEK